MMNAGNASTTTQAPSVNFVARKTTVATVVTTAPRPLRLARYRQRGGRVRRQRTTSPLCDKVKPVKTPTAYSGMSRVGGAAVCGGQRFCLSITSRRRMAASLISRYFCRAARTSAAFRPQRWTRSKSPYGNLYLALVCSDASSSTPRCQLAYSSQPWASMKSFSALADGWCSLQSSLWSSTTWPCLIWSCANSQECLFRLVVMGVLPFYLDGGYGRAGQAEGCGNGVRGDHRGHRAGGRRPAARCRGARGPGGAADAGRASAPRRGAAHPRRTSCRAEAVGVHRGGCGGVRHRRVPRTGGQARGYGYRDGAAARAGGVRRARPRAGRRRGGAPGGQPAADLRAAGGRGAAAVPGHHAGGRVLATGPAAARPGPGAG